MWKTIPSSLSELRSRARGKNEAFISIVLEHLAYTEII